MSASADKGKLDRDPLCGSRGNALSKVWSHPNVIQEADPGAVTINFPSFRKGGKCRIGCGTSRYAYEVQEKLQSVMIFVNCPLSVSGFS